MSSITDNGPFLCVEEVTRLFKISRTKAYKEPQLYIETTGKAGIPAVRVVLLDPLPVRADRANGCRPGPAA